MIRALLLTATLALALVPFAEAKLPVPVTGDPICVGGIGGICVVAENGCVGVGFGLQGVGACSRNGCAFVFIGFNDVGACPLS